MKVASVSAVIGLCVGCAPPQKVDPKGEPPPLSRGVSKGRVAYPTTPTPAFVPPSEGGCSSDYHLVERTCVHRAYEATPEALSQSLVDYARGVSPPILGPGAPRATEPSNRRPLDPGSLTKHSTEDAGSAKDRRLADLDAMLEAAREKLREKEEGSKAKRVDGPKPAASSTASRDAPASPVPGAATGSAAAGNATAGSPMAPSQTGDSRDPAEQRLAELSRLSNMLSSEQLQAMSAELAKAGIDAKQLEALVQQTRGGEQQQQQQRP